MRTFKSYSLSKFQLYSTVLLNMDAMSYIRIRGVQPFGISEPHWKNKSCLGPHIKYTNTNEN